MSVYEYIAATDYDAERAARERAVELIREIATNDDCKYASCGIECRAFLQSLESK